MSIYLTQIEKHRFVCGLFWQSLSRPRELNKEAAELASNLDFDLLVLRTDQFTAQAGFAQSKDGVRRGTYSLAAAVNKAVAMEGAFYDGRKQRVHNWLGAFKLPDGMWAYFAVRDANFLPNGDFAGSREEVLERLHGDYALGGWNVVIGDAELADLGFHNFNAKRIEDILPHTRRGQIIPQKWWALRSVKKTMPWRTVTVAVSVLAIAAAGGFAYWQHQKKLAEEARQRAIEEMRRKSREKAVPVALKHPWIDKPAPQAMAQACVDQFSHLAAGGWKLEEYVCTNDKATYTWSRQQSTISNLLAQLPGAIVDLSGDKAVYSERIDPGAGRDEKLLPEHELLDPVVSRLQAIELKPKLAHHDAPPPPPPPPTLAGGKPVPVPLPDWKTFTFSLDCKGLPPLEIVSILGQPGVRIDKLTYRVDGWSIQGVMYAK
jgi:hypothetical protein